MQLYYVQKKSLFRPMVEKGKKKRSRNFWKLELLMKCGAALEV